MVIIKLLQAVFVDRTGNKVATRITNEILKIQLDTRSEIKKNYSNVYLSEHNIPPPLRSPLKSQLVVSKLNTINHVSCMNIQLLHYINGKPETNFLRVNKENMTLQNVTPCNWEETTPHSYKMCSKTYFPQNTYTN